MIDGRQTAHKISDLFCIHDGSVSNTREKCDVLLGPKRGNHIKTKAGRGAGIGSLQNWWPNLIRVAFAAASLAACLLWPVPLSKYLPFTMWGQCHAMLCGE